HVARLARYESIMAEHYPEPASLNDRRKGRYLGLRMGILTERTTIAWCEEAIAFVDVTTVIPDQTAASAPGETTTKRRRPG
ncbi:hypothetical protein NQU36_27725, partial [Escherichia coli]|uniref:hypothetical protein n=1 Tax=Escherichia coli TaxID=562 RepID=UPI002119578A